MHLPLSIGGITCDFALPQCQASLSEWPPLRACRDQDGKLDFEEFVNMNRKFPMLFYPAFRMQVALQEFTLGKRAHDGLVCVCVCV